MKTEEGSTTKEVTCKVLGSILKAAKRKEMDMSVLLEGVPYDLSYLSNKHERIEWKYLCRICSNSRPFFTLSDYETIGRDYVRDGSYIEGVLTSFIFFSSSRIARMLRGYFFRVGDKDVTCFKHHLEYTADNNVRVTVYLDDSYEFCPEFFHMVKGVWNQFGEEIGHKDFRLEMTWIHQGVIFDVSWKKEGIAFRIKRWGRYMFNVKTAFMDLADSHQELLHQYNKLETSKQLLQKQTLRLETAYDIATSIRQSAEMEETLRTITQALVDDAGCSSARIRLTKDAEGNDLVMEALSGIDEPSVSPLTRSIMSDEKQVGEITIGPKVGTDRSEVEELLKYLLPIIGIAIHDLLVLRTVTDYRNNLETMIDKRTAELQITQAELSNTVRLLRTMQQVQNRFFTNISHEFRTPLTLILGPVKEIADRMDDEKTREELRIVHKNAKQLLRLVNQLLDLSRFDSGNMKLQASPYDIIPLFRGFVLSFASYAESKRIVLECNTREDEMIAYVDQEKMEKIFSNILSNAFKFTPEGGRIEVTMMKNEEHFTVSFKDSGIGIPGEKLPRIFDRFYQVEGHDTPAQQGTGVGLDLTKKLVELHKGTIAVESEEGMGTTFTIALPLGKGHLRRDEIRETDSVGQPTPSPSIEPKSSEKAVRADPGTMGERQQATVLLVEDNADLRNYVKRYLNGEYTVLEALDGEDGWNKSLEHMPDVIVSDVMMPKMDGFELCAKLKSDERTSHIPVVLLTAKATSKDRIEGFEKGADQYLMKPFEVGELRARLKSLGELAKRVREHFRRKGIFELDEPNITSPDKKFLQKVGDVISQNISRGSFSVELLAELTGVSRSVLHRKIVALTGEAPVELIRRIRLNRAATLIDKKSGNMAEISLEVGFANPAYFSECFKKQFGIPPSQYSQKSENQ
jgi:signal transduction histidine kinase/DNA-binding response OmpR family regulator